MSQNKNSGRTVFITGCSTGIGYCVAHGLKAAGYRVIASARQAEREHVGGPVDEPAGSQLLELLLELGGEATSVKAIPGLPGRKLRGAA